MLVVGHRGAAGLVAENTLASIEKAVAIGVDLIEIDVQTTADDALVVFHDLLLDRLTDLSGYLRARTAAELRERARVAGEIIPTLREVCALIRPTEITLLVELKVEGPEQALLETLLEALGPDRFVISSFLHDSIRTIKEADPRVRTQMLIDGAPIDPVAMAEQCRCDSIGLGFGAVTPRLLDKLAGAGRDLFVWTVDDAREIARAARMPIQGIISNFPDRVKAVLSG